MLYIKQIRDHFYVYYGLKESESVSLGKLTEVIALTNMRIANRSRDKQAIQNVLLLQGRDNLVGLLDLPPSELRKEFDSNVITIGSII